MEEQKQEEYAKKVLEAYPQASPSLKEGYCKRCRKIVNVIEIEPSTDADKITAMPIIFMDEDSDSHWEGYICFDCAKDYEKYLSENGCCVMIGFNGLGCSPDFTYFAKKEVAIPPNPEGIGYP